MPLPWLTVALLASFAASALLTALARRYALGRQLLDQPGERRSHVVATPRGGGIAIVLSQLLALVGIGLAFPAVAGTLAVFAAGLSLVAGIGWWDDHKPLPALPRLLVHVLAALLLGALVWYWTADAFKAVFTVLLAAGLVNVWNFMDGINGLAASQAILVAVACALLLPAPLAPLPLLLAAAVAGFLPFNFPRARIFMGDVGSGALGYLVAGMVALGLVGAADIGWMTWLVPLTAFGIDAGLTLSVRILNGERWMQAHKQHLYQRYVERGASHAAVTGFYALFTLLAVILALLLSRLSPVSQQCGALLWLLLSALLWMGLRKLNVRQGGNSNVA